MDRRQLVDKYKEEVRVAEGIRNYADALEVARGRGVKKGHAPFHARAYLEAAKEVRDPSRSLWGGRVGLRRYGDGGPPGFAVFVGFDLDVGFFPAFGGFVRRARGTP